MHDPVGVHALHFAQQRRNVAVARAGQVARHFRFRRQARLHAADDFQDHRVADDDRAVGLFARQPMHLDITVEIHVLKPGFRQEADHARLVARLAAAASVQFRAGLHGLERAAHEPRLQEGVGQHADLGAAAHAGNRVLDDGGFVPDQHEGRLRPDALGAVLGLDLGPVVFAVCRFERGGVGQPRTRGRFGTGKPTLARQILRQDFTFQRGARCIGQRRAAARLEHQRDQFGHLFGRRRMPSGRRGVLAQIHPVKAVGRQRQQVRQFTDGGEGRAPQHLHRHPAIELLHMQLDRLRRVRQVGDAQDRGVFPLPQVGQDLAVAGKDETQRAAPEGVALAALRQQTARPVQQGMRVALLRFDVDGLVPVQGSHQHRQRQALRVGA